MTRPDDQRWPARTGQSWSTTSGSARVRVPKPSDTEAPRDGDHAHTARKPKQVSCMNFKASTTTKPLIQSPNHFCYAKEAILDYKNKP